MKRVLLLFVLAVALSGCATMQYNYKPAVTQADWPSLNEQVTVYVGEEMLIQGMKLRGIMLEVPAIVTGSLFIVPAGKYPKVGEDAERVYFSLEGTNGSARKNSSWAADPAGLFVAKKNPAQVCVTANIDGYQCYDSAIQIKEIEAAAADRVQQNLIYSGFDGKQARFTYVERLGPNTVFAHNVSYDMHQSLVINYRGAQIKIHHADNERITYTVTKNFTGREGGGKPAGADSGTIPPPPPKQEKEQKIQTRNDEFAT